MNHDVAIIELSQGKLATIDISDLEQVNTYKWYLTSKGYAETKIRTEQNKRKSVRMHRYILNADPCYQVDHIDGNPLNNKRSNLRLVTHRQNLQNRHHKKSSKYPGVSWDWNTHKWKAQITVNRKNLYLGVYQTEEQAYQIYKNAVSNNGERIIGE